MTNTRVSFIILNWNTKDITKKCVDSIYKYIPSHIFELILVDNGSTDNSQALFEKYQLKHKNFKIIKNKKNLGFSAGNNIGAKAAKTNTLIFLNSDTQLKDDSILKAVNYLSSNPKVGLIAPKLILDNGNIQASVYHPQTIPNAIKEYWLNQKNSFSPFYPIEKSPTQISSAAGAVFIITKTLFNKIGGWNEKYFLYFEDMELCRQVRQKNKSIAYYPDCQILHHHGQSGKSLATHKDQWKRLVPSSIRYHGFTKHYLLYFIILLGQKWQKLTNKI